MAALADDESADAAPDGGRAARRGGAYLGIAVVIGLAAWLLAGLAALNFAH
jgi:hypothetical protein